MTLTLQPLPEGDPACFHFYRDGIEGYTLECEKCGRQITEAQWTETLNLWQHEMDQM